MNENKSAGKNGEQNDQVGSLSPTSGTTKEVNSAAGKGGTKGPESTRKPSGEKAAQELGGGPSPTSGTPIGGDSAAGKEDTKEPESAGKYTGKKAVQDQGGAQSATSEIIEKDDSEND